MTYLLVAGAVLAVNLLPVFGPPTWAVLVLFYLRGDLSEITLVMTGASAAAAGRLTLAHATRRLGDHLPAKQRRNLGAAGTVLLRRRAGSLAALALFALSPLPSAQLFEAAGLMRVRLLTLTGAFFLGRLVSYSIYLGGARAFRSTSAADVMLAGLTSPYGLLIEVVMLAALVALAQVDWTSRLRHEPSDGGAPLRRSRSVLRTPSPMVSGEQMSGPSSLRTVPLPGEAGVVNKTRHGGQAEEKVMKLSAQSRSRQATPSSRVDLHNRTIAAPSLPVVGGYLLGVLRVCLGWVFLWAFLDKTFGLGHDTTSKQAWIHGGSPTYGFLHFSASGPFASFYKDIAGQGWADWLFMLGLVSIGIGLCAGIAMRASSVAAAIMLLLMWSVVLPPANNPFMDDHLIYAIAILALPVLQAERMLGLGTWWKQTALVRRFPVLS